VGVDKNDPLGRKTRPLNQITRKKKRWAERSVRLKFRVQGRRGDFLGSFSYQASSRKIQSGAHPGEVEDGALEPEQSEEHGWK